MFIVYAIFNPVIQRIYIGQTVDLVLRLSQHNGVGAHHLGKFTKQNAGSWKLVYQESYVTRAEAVKREKQLKSYRGRQFIKNIIMHP